ncbi:MAG TPA: Gfo/Idh/MocA family oxidoreductase [Dongiaceae bacterium]|jgi:predicted dehydrogenase|nr:Gfo/Idh/MocA family oxidoreductase [Dongiaceae bacterium]
MADRRWRGALIGCGFFARNHMHGWTGIERAEIVAVCDRDQAKARSMAEDFKVPAVYTDAAELLDREQIDFVDVATTVPSHRPLVELAARRGKAIICQKPFAESMADAEAMVNAAEKAGVPLAVHENFRWQRPFLEIGRRIAAGRIGKPTFARFSFRHGYDNYRNQPYLAEIKRFTIMDVGLHLFDLARHLIGDVSTLSCRTQRLNPIVQGEDSFASMLGHDNGATSIVDCSFFSKIDPEPFPQTLAWIEGMEGTLELTAGYRLIAHRPGSATTTDVEPAVPAWGAKPWHAIQDSVVNFERHFIDVLDGKSAPMPSGAHNLKTLALALAAYEAAEQGAIIDMKSWRET